jgi:hypothetical protein
MGQGCFLHAVANQIEIIPGDRITIRFAAHGFDLCGEYQRVIFQNVACLEFAPNRNEFRARWQDSNSGHPGNDDILMS